MRAAMWGLVVATVIAVGCSDGYRTTTVSSGSLELSPEWQVIELPDPTYCDRSQQEILLTIETPHSLDPETWGVRLNDGRIAIPEIIIEDTRGTKYALEDRAFWGEYLVLSGGNSAYSHRYFRRLWIRSNVPVRVARIEWNCFNMQDVKR